MNKELKQHLMERYEVQKVRYLKDPDYRAGAIECYGTMPNTNQEGWFFVGFEDELLQELSHAH